MTKNTDYTIIKDKKIKDFYYSMDDNFDNLDIIDSYEIKGENDDNCSHITQNIKESVKTEVKDKLNSDKEIILESWVNSAKIDFFMEKFKVKVEEKNYYIKYFGDKIIGFLIDNFGEDKICSDVKYIFLTTKFFDYIKGKDVGVDDLLKIIIILKNIIIEYIKHDAVTLDEITLIFDNIGVILSKEYNSTAVKLLKEYANAIDKTNIIAKINIWGNLTYINDECCRLTGYNKEELIGQPFTDLNLHSTEKTFSRVLETINNKKIWSGVITSRKKNDDPYWLKVTIVPIVDENDNVLEHICIMTDITDIEIAKEQLKQSFDNLKELDIKKDEFLNIASHELRTPMTSIRGYISMILDGDAGEINSDVKNYLEQVHNNASRLITLINDMLDVSKLESEKQEFTFEKVNIKNLLLETGNELRQLFIDKKQAFEIDIMFDGYYNTDQNKLKQVIINLLGNANKFTPEEKGKIKLTAFTKNEELHISVIDNGTGIDQKHFGVIFEKFGQIKNSLTRNYTGTGLGLSIARQIVEKLGGKIEIISELGKGSNFTIILPIKNN